MRYLALAVLLPALFALDAAAQGIVLERRLEETQPEEGSNRPWRPRAGLCGPLQLRDGAVETGAPPDCPAAG